MFDQSKPQYNFKIGPIDRRVITWPEKTSPLVVVMLAYIAMYSGTRHAALCARFPGDIDTSTHAEGSSSVDSDGLGPSRHGAS